MFVVTNLVCCILRILLTTFLLMFPGLDGTYDISLVPYGFDPDTADQSTKFCTLIPLDV